MTRRVSAKAAFIGLSVTSAAGIASVLGVGTAHADGVLSGPSTGTPLPVPTTTSSPLSPLPVSTTLPGTGTSSSSPSPAPTNSPSPSSTPTPTDSAAPSPAASSSDASTSIDWSGVSTSTGTSSSGATTSQRSSKSATAAVHNATKASDALLAPVTVDPQALNQSSTQAVKPTAVAGLAPTLQLGVAQLAQLPDLSRLLYGAALSTAPVAQQPLIAPALTPFSQPVTTAGPHALPALHASSLSRSTSGDSIGPAVFAVAAGGVASLVARGKRRLRRRRTT